MNNLERLALDYQDYYFGQRLAYLIYNRNFNNLIKLAVDNKNYYYGQRLAYIIAKELDKNAMTAFYMDVIKFFDLRNRYGKKLADDIMKRDGIDLHTGKLNNRGKNEICDFLVTEINMEYIMNGKFQRLMNRHKVDDLPGAQSCNQRTIDPDKIMRAIADFRKYPDVIKVLEEYPLAA